MLQEQFLSGLPSKFAAQWRLNVVSSGPVTTSSLVSQARALVAMQTARPGGATAVVVGLSRPLVTCYKCHRTAH